MYDTPDLNLLKWLSKKKPVKYIYRVEGVNDKYQGTPGNCWKAQSDWGRLPRPQDDVSNNIGYYNNKFINIRETIVCGTASLQQLYRWWPKSKWKYLPKGMRVVKLETEGYVCRLNHQVTFNRAKARIVEVIYTGKYNYDY